MYVLRAPSRRAMRILRIARLLILLVLTTSSDYFSQEETDLCGLVKLSGFTPPSDALSAHDVLDAIGKVVPFQTRTIMLWPSSDRLVRDAGGAAAKICGEPAMRYVFFDQRYIDDLRVRGTRDPRYFVLAHEAAHHINGDTLNGTHTKDEELAADRAAAMWLIRLGVADDDLLKTVDSFRWPATSVNGYPTRDERRDAVNAGIEAEHLIERVTGGKLNIDWPVEYVSLGETVTVTVTGVSGWYALRLTSSVLPKGDEFPRDSSDLPAGLTFDSTDGAGSGRIKVDKSAPRGDVPLTLYVKDSDRVDAKIFKFPLTLRVRFTIDNPDSPILGNIRGCLSNDFGVVPQKKGNAHVVCYGCDQQNRNVRQQVQLLSNVPPNKMLYPRTGVDDSASGSKSFAEGVCLLLNQGWTDIYERFRK